MLDKSYGEGDLVSQGKDTYCRNIYLCVERVKDLAFCKGNQLVRTNLNTVLRGAVQSWYLAEISQNKRDFMRDDPNGVEEWCNSLIL